MSDGASRGTPAYNRLRLGSRYAKWASIAEWGLLVALLAIFVGRGFLPAWRTLNTDFPNYYLAASLYRRGISLDQVYEWTWFQRQKDYLEVPQPLVGYVPSPPICVLPVLPLSGLAPLAAKRAWLVLNVGFLLLAMEFLRRATRLNSRRIALTTLLCVLPLRTNFLFGQYYVLILLLICAAYYSSCLGHRLTSGSLLSVAASLKLFPALFLILFVRKRDWRSATGLLLGTVALTAISVAIFGLDVHRVFLVEVLPRALRGEMVGPYSAQWSSFTALWHRLFLVEPELNPSPLLNSPFVYAVTQAISATALLFGFLWSTSEDRARSTKALEWSALVLLSLLLSAMPSSYHYCVLIFAGVVGMDELLKTCDKRSAIAFMMLFLITCAPAQAWLGKVILPRLVGTLALYVLLLRTVAPHKDTRPGSRWLTTAVVVCTVLTISNLNSLKNRAEDFRRRLSNLSIGYSASNPVAIGGRVIFTEMLDENYGAMSLQNGEVHPIPIPGDVLSIGGNEGDTVGYFEHVTAHSSIVQFPFGSDHPNPEYLAEGERPTVSSDGRWISFIRQEGGRSTAWLYEIESKKTSPLMLDLAPNVLDVSVTSEGDLIAAAGPISAAHLIMVRRSTGESEPLAGIAGPVRYPAISPDGKRLAFSRRTWGSWQLVVRVLATGTEQQLTHTACNATLPSWGNTHTLMYATDCGRGFGLTALARVTLPD